MLGIESKLGRQAYKSKIRSNKLYRLFRKVYQLNAKSKMDHLGLSSLLTNRPSETIPPDFADLFFLYRMVRIRKPKVVLEFGSGCSTIILAQALYENSLENQSNSGYCYSVDADPKWTSITINSIPPYLKTLCKVSYSPLKEVECYGTPAFLHQNVPDVKPDIVYLDGPALTPKRQVAADILCIEDNFPKNFYMVVDGRQDNVEFLAENLGRTYICRQRILLDNTTFELVD